ncbi:Copper amine oxidase N-terminal domain-containing protein [Paenibacillus sp. 1_12]|uniref:stalk domain-containing protein n=1 Tax=Paenibacillus sp. 1_12 TaxID=1566278 RepID=UPI0008EEAEF3|nr:stalk domain-containing protein [Paenibacillus sp. 1_12]SFL81602.1 Copper amine oxidase N-terminal domain-containing protein [Paenibacillus sp. 1_12]
MFRMVAAAKATLLLSTVLTVGLTNISPVAAVSVSSTQLQLFAGKSEAFMNTQRVTLDEPPAMINGQFYLPIKWVADALRMQLIWDEHTQTAQMLTSKAFIQFNPSLNQIQVNGKPIPFNSVAEIRNGRMLVNLTWLATYTNMTYRFDFASQSAELADYGEPASAYKESTLRKDDTQQNSRPIAKFAFGKATYRLGEPITYTDLSYDPDSEGLPGYDWKGKQDVFFKPGTYTVTLTVKDGKGNESEPFSQSIQILDIPYISEQAYPFYFKPLGSLLSKEAVASITKQSLVDPTLSVSIAQPENRRLLLGSSKKPIMEKGFLFQEKINGQARLYTQYINGMNSNAQLAVMIRNQSDTRPVLVSTTTAAESQASVYTSILGSKTVENFLANQLDSDSLTINPGAAVFYKVSPELGLGQGFQGIYDIKSDGAVDVSYVMVAPGEQPYQLGDYRNLQSKELRRSVFPVSDVSWQVDARSLKAPISLGIGDGSVEPTLKEVIRDMGVEPVQPVSSVSNAGARYRINLELNGKMAVALYPRGGFFEGAIRVNGNVISMPGAGLTSNEAILLHRTSGSEKKIEIELMTAESNQLPLDLILYPLPDKQ